MLSRRVRPIFHTFPMPTVCDSVPCIVEVIKGYQSVHIYMSPPTRDYYSEIICIIRKIHRSRNQLPCAIHGFLRKLRIHRLCSTIHGSRRSTDCAQHQRINTDVWVVQTYLTINSLVVLYDNTYTEVILIMFTRSNTKTVQAVSILGFENCQSFFPATAHVQCTAPARPTPRGQCLRHIAYFIGKTTLRSSYQPTTCEQLYKKHNIVTCLYKTSRLLQ